MAAVAALGSGAMRRAISGAIAGLLAILGALETSAAADAGAEPCPARLAAEVPARPAKAPGGKIFAQTNLRGSKKQRDDAAAAALISGDLPAFLRHLHPVVLGGAAGTPRITLCVAPDYLAIGSDTDFLRMPLGLPAAMRVATNLGFILPTRKIVDAIYAQADVRLEPRPMPPTSEMVSTAYFTRHNGTIEAQRRERGARLGALVAGQKKDLVVTPRLWSKPGRMAIYGWHRPDGRAIQPLSTVHGATYADYSHGVRLVSTVVTVDGERRSIYDVLADPALAPLLSDEGPMPRLRELVAATGGITDGATRARRLAASVRLASSSAVQLAQRPR